MNFKLVGRIIAMLLLVEAVLMVPSMLICVHDRERIVVYSFLITIVSISATGMLMLRFSRNARKDFYAQEGFVTTGLSWIFMSLFGALPFFISGQIPNYIDAVFETVSGFTTTGASILVEVEPMSRGLLFWRSFTHWIGGMGMLVFLLAVLPAVGKNAGSNLYLLRAESPGPAVGKFTPRIHHTAMILYGIYVVLTILCFLFLIAGDMPVFDSLCTAFGTAGTGGFGVKNDSMASYSTYLQNVTAVFMLLFGVNFNIYYALLLKRFKSAFCDEELRLYFGIVAFSIIAITINIASMFDNWREALHHSAFQVSSIITTTGFTSMDFDIWPSFSKTILLLLMCFGACAGSTGGGIKMVRLLLLIKGVLRNIRKTIHPRQVRVVQLNHNPMDEKILSDTNSYLAAYCLIVLMSVTIVSLDNFGIATNLSAVLACFNNIGPGLEAVGAIRNYSMFSIGSKIMLTFDMLLGRLEIFPILLLFNHNTWRRNG